MRSKLAKTKRSFYAWLNSLSDKRSQHLVFLGHVWLLAPFIVLWLQNKHVQDVLGAKTVTQLQPAVMLVIVYLAIRSWVAWRDNGTLRWEYIFPPIDVALITVVLCLSHRGPMSNISLLYFLPIIGGAATLNVGWSASVGFMVVLGTALSTFYGLGVDHRMSAENLRELWQAESLNIMFRLYFLVVVSSLMTYQALIAAGMKEKLAVAADRNRIAADMHDGVQGHLITVASQLELLSRLVEKDPARAMELAKDAREMARQGADELRFLVQRMRAPALSDGFVPALRQYAHNICTRNELELVFSFEGTPRGIEPEEEAALFRVAQEALNNIVKHAKAQRVRVIVQMGVKVELRIEDDGVGFDQVRAEPSDGLKGMCGRLEKLGGEVSVTSAPRKGTIVEAKV